MIYLPEASHCPQATLEGLSFPRCPVERARELLTPDDLQSLLSFEMESQHSITHMRNTALLWALFLPELIHLVPYDDPIEILFGLAIHDIGKTYFVDHVNSPGSLSESEFNELKDHTVRGYHLLVDHHPEGNIIPLIARWHHERYDGNGYPDSLCGEETIMAARIAKVIDCMEALLSPYREHYRRNGELKGVAEYLRRNEGHEFDPTVATIVSNLMLDPSYQNGIRDIIYAPQRETGALCPMASNLQP